ncbi:MAG: hypothetical protein H6721_07750 [Sandaracinus sp.]|nr:hypothetical protein [Sandaracinus sp.]MCB9613695.1 hypothetical protein [Sandaracinus sp.]MCB9632013.1 hypothetical protein [Sandaracinus sp.]
MLRDRHEPWYSCPMDLEAHWAPRQDLLAKMLDELGATNCDWRVDLGRGAFWWQRKDGTPVVVASTRGLCSFALSNRSFLMAWANQSLPPGAAIPPVEGMDDAGTTDEAGAWAIAMEAGMRAGAHFLYRAPTPQMHIFLGLWDVRPAGPEDAPFEVGSPWPHAKHVVSTLREGIGTRPDADLRTLLRNYGETFRTSEVHRGTPHDAAVKELGAALQALADAPNETVAPELDRLLADIVRRMAS